jgi:hypothetical protein
VLGVGTVLGAAGKESPPPVCPPPADVKAAITRMNADDALISGLSEERPAVWR